MTTPKTIRTFQNFVEAENARAYLEAHGVAAEIPDRHSLIHQSHLIPVIGGVRLQVPEADFTKAEELLAEVDRRAHLSSVDSSEDDYSLQQRRRQSAVRWLARFIAGVVILYWLIQHFGSRF